jgi:hypothetical protein
MESVPSMSGFYAIASRRRNAFSADMRWVRRVFRGLPRRMLGVRGVLWALCCIAPARAEIPIIGAVAPFPEDPAWRWFCVGVRERLDSRWGQDGYEWREQRTLSAGVAGQEAALTALLGRGSLDALILCPEPAADYDRVERVLRLDGTPVFSFGRSWGLAESDLECWHGTVDPVEAWGWVQTVVFDLMEQEGVAVVRGADAASERPWAMRPIASVDRRPATGNWALRLDPPTHAEPPAGWVLLGERELFDLDELERRHETAPIVAALVHPVVLSRLESGTIDALVMPDYPGLGARAAEALLHLKEGRGAATAEVVVQRFPLVLTAENFAPWAALWQRYAE